MNLKDYITENTYCDLIIDKNMYCGWHTCFHVYVFKNEAIEKIEIISPYGKLSFEYEENNRRHYIGHFIFKNDKLIYEQDGFNILFYEV